MSTLDELFQTKKIITAPQGRIIVYEGHEVNKIYRVANGYIKVYAISGANNQRVLFIYKPGDIFPLTTFLSGDTIARFFYETMTPTTLQCITPKQLENQLKDNLQLGEEVIGYTDYLDRIFLDRINNMVSGQEPLNKIKALLLSFCDRIDTKNNIVTLEMPLSPRLIANMCGITAREAIKQINFLKSENIIFLGGSLKVDRQKLKKLKSA
jgi:CRP-like cAMP-binding protein